MTIEFPYHFRVADPGKIQIRNPRVVIKARLHGMHEVLAPTYFAAARDFWIRENAEPQCRERVSLAMDLRGALWEVPRVAGDDFIAIRGIPKEGWTFSTGEVIRN